MLYERIMNFLAGKKYKHISVERRVEMREVLHIIKLLDHICLFKRREETLAANRGTLSSANINISGMLGMSLM